MRLPGASLCVLATVCLLPGRSRCGEGGNAALVQAFRDAVEQGQRASDEEGLRRLGEALSRQVRRDDTAFLRERALDRWTEHPARDHQRKRIEQRLAVWALGFAGTREGVDALVQVAVGRRSTCRIIALCAIAESRDAEARRGLEAVLTAAMGDPFAAQMRVRAALFLRAFGDQESLGLLEQQHGKAGEADLRQALRTCVANLGLQLREPDIEKRRAYAAFERVFWRQVSLAPGTRSITGKYWKAAQGISAELETVPFDLVMRKLDLTTATREEIAVAAYLCALRNETRALPAFRRLREEDAGRSFLTGLFRDLLQGMEKGR